MLATRSERSPDDSRVCSNRLVDRQHSAGRYEPLELAQLFLERLPRTQGDAVATQPLEHADRGNRQATVFHEVRLGACSNGRVTPRQL